MNQAKIIKENGYVFLSVNGKIIPPLMYASSDLGLYDKTQQSIKDFKDCGINLVSVCSNICADWKENGDYYPNAPLECVRKVLAANPDAKIIIRLNLSAPYWWMRKYPDEVIKYYGVLSADTGSDGTFFSKDKTNEIKVSFASKKWKDDVCEILKKLCFVLQNDKDGQSVIGIQVAYGTCGEWHFFGKYYDNGTGIFEGDYSEAMKGFFREYLKDKYKTETALSESWGIETTFSTAELATPKERKNYVEDDKYLLPEFSMRALDSLKCMHLSAVSAIKTFASAIKESTDNRYLVGTFYGYFFACGDVFGRMLESKALYDDDNIDYLSSPNAYTANKKSGNYAYSRCLLESIRLNGKLFLCEMDQGYKSYCVYKNEPTDTYLCENNEEYNALVRRNICENLLRGCGAWFFDHRHPKDDYTHKQPYWGDSEKLENIANLTKFYYKMLELRPEYKSTNDVLLVFDSESVYNLGTGEMHNTYCNFDFLDAVAKSGAGYDCVYLYDIEKIDISNYKCVVFTYCVKMTGENVSYIKNKVMGNGRTVAFIGTNGYIVDDKTSYSNVKNLYGVIPKGNYKSKRKDYTIVSTDGYVYDSAYYAELFKNAGAHMYTENGEVLTAANDLVMYHCTNKKETALNLKCGKQSVKNGKYQTAVFDSLTGEKIL